MAFQQTTPKGVNGAIEWIVVDLIAPRLSQIPLRYKTLVGCLLIGIAGACHFAIGLEATSESIDRVLAWIVSTLGWAGPILTGIGVVHKVAKASPERMKLKKAA